MMQEKDEQPQRKPITCDVGQHRKLAYVSADGIYLYCKSCRSEHHISWQKLEILHKNAVAFNIALEIHQSV